MDRYKNFVRIEELKSLLAQEKYEEALEIAEGMEPRKIKDNLDCMVIADVFLKKGMLGKARECYLIVYDRKKSRKVAMELFNICIRMKKADEAETYYDDYRRMAPDDYYNYIFKYRLDKLKGKPLREQALDLEALKRKEFFDNWGYELAKIYHKMGDTESCRKVCEDVIIWFGDGEAVEKAKTLKAYCQGDITLKELTSGKKAEEKTDSDKYQENIDENIEEKNKEDSGEGLEKNIGENIEESSGENFEDGSGENFSENVNYYYGENFEENYGNNFGDDSSESFDQNIESGYYDIESYDENSGQYMTIDKVEDGIVEFGRPEEDAGKVKNKSFLFNGELSALLKEREKEEQFVAESAEEYSDQYVEEDAGEYSADSENVRTDVISGQYVEEGTAEFSFLPEDVNVNVISGQYMEEGTTEYTVKSGEESEMYPDKYNGEDIGDNLDQPVDENVGTYSEQYAGESIEGDLEQSSGEIAKIEENDVERQNEETIEFNAGRSETDNGSQGVEDIVENFEDNSGEEEDEDDIKVYRKEELSSTASSEILKRNAVQESDLFTEEIARAVEEALKEESIAKKEEVSDPNEATKEWRKPEVSKAILEGTKAAENEKESEQNGPLEKAASSADNEESRKDIQKEIETQEENGEDISDEDIRKVDSKLMEAVDRELGFVDSEDGQDKEKSSGEKKSWRERWKEKRQEKERRKKEEKEEEEKEQLRKIRELELEKQKFIESEKRKDKIKYLEHQKQIAVLSNRKAEEELRSEEMAEIKRKQTQKSENKEDFIADFKVDTQDIQQESERREIKGDTYVPKSLTCIEIPRNSIVAECLAETKKDLEYYFGFFACHKVIGNLVLRCLEKLLDPEEEYMNYCIIGERGNGKKALAHGFAKFMYETGKLISPQVIWTGADKINSTDLRGKTEKLKGRCLVIDMVGGLDEDGAKCVSDVLDALKKKGMIVIADYRRNMVDFFESNEKIEECFAPRISIPEFSLEDLYDYVDYKFSTAGFIFNSDAYDLLQKRIKSIMRATEEGVLARTEKYIMKVLDNAEQRNGEEYIRQTLENVKHVRSNVIILKDIPESL